MKEIQITKNSEGQRLIRYLERILKNAPDSFLYRMLRKKNITLNGTKAGGNEILKAGDVLRIYFSDETYKKFAGQKAGPAAYPALEADRIVYEDENVLLYNKPAGLLSQRSAPDDVSACELLIGYLQQKGAFDDSAHPSFVNRLDRNTTGLIIGAKNAKAARELTDLVTGRMVKKEYICLAKGRITDAADETAYLVKDERLNKVSVYRNGDEANRIETAYTPIRFCDKLNCTVLLVELKTGRPHQIRAHLSYLGYPVAGDAKYGDPKWNRKLREDWGITHQMLHSYRLTFPACSGTLSSISGKTFSADPPFGNLYEHNVISGTNPLL